MKKIVFISVIIGFISFSATAQTSTTPSTLSVKKSATTRSSVSKAVDQSKIQKETQTTTAPENKTTENTTTTTKETTPSTTKEATPTTTKCQQSKQTTNTSCAKKCPNSGMKCSTPCHQNLNKIETKTVVPKQ